MTCFVPDCALPAGWYAVEGVLCMPVCEDDGKNAELQGWEVKRIPHCD